jgi:hypothetical protein
MMLVKCQQVNPQPHGGRRLGRYKSVPLIQVGPLGYFMYISMTTPIVPALKNYHA